MESDTTARKLSMAAHYEIAPDRVMSEYDSRRYELGSAIDMLDTAVTGLWNELEAVLTPNVTVELAGAEKREGRATESRAPIVDTLAGFQDRVETIGRTVADIRQRLAV